MKAVRLYGVCDLRQEEIPTPHAGPGEILLRVKATALCGTDVRMYLNGAAGIDQDHPRVIGHEISGVIEEMGEGVQGYELGQRVCVAPNFGCGVCDSCVSGNTHLCGSYQALGINLDGGLAEYVLVPARAVSQGNVAAMADHVSFEEASIVEPLSCVYNGQEQVGIRPGDKVLVIGAGPIGVMHALLANMQGAGLVMMNDLSPDRLRTCREIDPSIVTVEGNLKEQVMERTGGRVHRGLPLTSGPDGSGGAHGTVRQSVVFRRPACFQAAGAHRHEPGPLPAVEPARQYQSQPSSVPEGSGIRSERAVAVGKYDHQDIRPGGDRRCVRRG